MQRQVWNFYKTGVKIYYFIRWDVFKVNTDTNIYNLYMVWKAPI